MIKETMSSQIGDENNDSSNDLLLPISSRLDSGYLTYISSPSRLSPTNISLNEHDSPISEYDIQSPINAAKKKFHSTIDYEQYISTRKHFDILTQLSYRNAYHLIDEIFQNLSNNDLYHCSNVCKKWYLLLKDYYQRQKTKNVKRNLFNNKKTSKRKLKLTSTPMQTITNLLETKSSIPLIIETITNDENILPKTPLQNIYTSSPDKKNNTIHLAASTMTYRYGYLKYLHGPTVPKRCPICAYVSIVDVNDQHG